MSEIEHTPGPWQVSAGAVDNPRLIVENDLALPICAMSLRGVHGDTRRMEANARLIAAAPDLLEALQDFTKALIAERDAFYDFVSDRDGKVDDPNDAAELGRLDALIDNARAAIAKATGGES